jgi:hypothetical protein
MMSKYLQCDWPMDSSNTNNATEMTFLALPKDEIGARYHDIIEIRDDSEQDVHIIMGKATQRGKYGLGPIPTHSQSKE